MCITATDQTVPAATTSLVRGKTLMQPKSLPKTQMGSEGKPEPSNTSGAEICWEAAKHPRAQIVGMWWAGQWGWVSGDGQ